MKNKTRKNILFILPVFQCGGVERVFKNILSCIDRDKYAPFLVVLDTYGLYREWLPNDIPIYMFEKKRRYDFFKLIYHLAFNIFPKTHTDLVVSFAEYANLLSLMAAKLYRKKLPVIVTEHNVLSIALKHTRLWKLKKFLIKRLYTSSKKIIPVSEQIKIDLHMYFSVPDEKMEVIYNPIDFKLIQSLSKHLIPDVKVLDESIPIITACGRLAEQKNYPLLLNAFAELLQNHEARLVILGGGDKKESLLQLTEELKIKKYVNFLGVQDNPFKFYDKSAIYVLSSSWEGFPNSLIEAMACGVACITTRCPSGIEEIITDGIDGLLVPVDNKYALAEAMGKLLTDNILRRQLADAGKKKVAALDIEKIIVLYERVFEKIFNKEK